MKEGYLLLIPMMLPVIVGIVLLTVKKCRDIKITNWITGCTLIVTTVIVWMLLFNNDKEFLLWNLTETLPIWLKLDKLGRYFAGFTAIVWTISGFFAFQYMHHEKNPHRFFGCYLLTFGILMGLDFSGNIITFYLFYELMTIVTMPLVAHSLTKESVAASLKYLFYSLFGAFMGLLGIFLIYGFCGTQQFTPGGVLVRELVSGHETFIQIAVMVTIIGFGTKAGMFPMHGWLPTAHPVAPAPASAVLSGVITKSGVLGIIRVLYYVVGFEYVIGTWVQTVALILSLLTVFMGSMMAFREKIFKKRLAYSTVSQVSYVLFGLFIMNETAMRGALLHIVFHSVIKNLLFLTAGAIIFYTGLTNVDEYDEMGKKMPGVMVCFMLCSLGLVGIPPLSGFVSKWYLATGAYGSGIGVFSWLGPIVLLISALLTAVYLLEICVKAFFSVTDKVETRRQESELCKINVSKLMLIPMIIYAALNVSLGIITSPLNSYLDKILNTLF